MKNEKLKMKNIAWLLGVVVSAASLHAQGPDFSGTWRLDEAKSKIVATAPIFGLIPAGAPKTLHITQPANGTVVIESQINEGHVRIYKPGRQSSTPAGQGGAVTVTTKWEGRTMVSDGALKAPNGDTTTVRESVSLSADGKVLTIDVTTAAAEKAASTLVYTKITDVGPCETWPTPCKKFP
jgi:surface antigen